MLTLLSIPFFGLLKKLGVPYFWNLDISEVSTALTINYATTKEISGKEAYFQRNSS
jgi:hypothetical protein